MSIVTLAYHGSAEGEVARLEQHLRNSGYRTRHLVCSADATTLADRLLEREGPLLLVINDPFLHSVDCQLGMLDAYRVLEGREHFAPVLASSKRMGPGGVEVRLLSSLSRVSDVIRYMNYWQNDYLVRRKTALSSATAEAHRDLAAVRRISQEIGEVLRLVRARKPIDVIALANADATALEEILGAPVPPSVGTADGPQPQPIAGSENTTAPPEPQGLNERNEETADDQAVELPDEEATPGRTDLTAAVDISAQVVEVPPSLPASGGDPADQQAVAAAAPEDVAEARDTVRASRFAPGLPSEEPSATSTFTSTVDMSQGAVSEGGVIEVIEEGGLGGASAADTPAERVDVAAGQSADASPAAATAQTEQEHSTNGASISGGASGDEEAEKRADQTTDRGADTSTGDATEGTARGELTGEQDVPHGVASDAPPAQPADEPESGANEATAAGPEQESVSVEATASAFDETIEASAREEEVTSAEDFAELAAEALALTRSRNLTTFLAHRDEGDPEDALAFARSCLASDETDYRMRYALAVGLLEEAEEDERHLDEAAVVMRELFDSPLAAQAHLCLGQIGVRLKDYGSARRHFRRAYKLNRRVDPELAYRLGALLQDEFEQPRKAMRYLRIAARRSRKNLADAHYRLGLLEADALKLRRAIRHFKLALQYEDQHPFAAYELAVTYVLRERPLRALSYFNRATRANPELDIEQNRQAFTPVDADGEPTRLPESSTDKFFGFVREMDGAERADDAALDLRDLGPLDSVPAGRPNSAPEESPDVSPELLPGPRKDGEPSLAREVLTVMITGASSGIGAAAARKFAAAGHRLILTGRRVDRLRALSDELRSRWGTAVRLLSYDVADFVSSGELVDGLDDDWSQIDLLINNAGKALGLKPVHEATREEIDDMVDTNVKGLLYMTRLVAPGMVERRRGHIINVCSTAGHEVYAGGTIYCATKHAVDAITRGTRLDLFRHGIRVSQVSPAAVEGTEFSEVRFGGDAERAASVYEGFRPLHARDVAETIYSIAMAPSHVNVQDVVVLSTQQGNSTSVDRSGRGGE